MRVNVKVRVSSPFLLTDHPPKGYLLAITNRGGASMEAYCFKCRTKREISKPQQVTLKNGRPATQGACPVCGTKVFRIGKG